jgi:hypothetical protein
MGRPPFPCVLFVFLGGSDAYARPILSGGKLGGLECRRKGGLDGKGDGIGRERERIWGRDVRLGLEEWDGLGHDMII